VTEAGAWVRGTDLAGAVVALADRVAGADGVAAISGHVLTAVRSGGADVLPATVLPATVPAADVLAAGAEFPAGAAGYAVAIAGDPAEVAVDPTARRRGIGTALVRAAVERQGAVWAYGDLPAARAVAARLQLRRTRVLLQMRCALPVEPTGGRLPPGVRIRTFEPGRDDEAFLTVNARAFATHPEQGRLDLAGLREEMSQEWFDPAGFFLAVTDPGDELLGFHWTKVHGRSAGPGETGPIGEVYVLGVDPDAGVRGLGTVLTDVGLRHLADRGLRTAMLYVEADNDRARRLYERAGFVVHLTNVVYRPAAAATG
jgi:mycothiol synthase